MSQNIERYRGAITAFNARDVEALIAYFDPEVEFHSAFAVVGGAVYRGHEELRSWHRDLEDTWEMNRLEPEVYFDLAEQTLAFHVYHARGRHSGAEVAMPIAHVARWRDGRVVHLRTYTDRANALRDLDVSEAALEPVDPCTDGGTAALVGSRSEPRATRGRSQMTIGRSGGREVRTGRSGALVVIVLSAGEPSRRRAGGVDEIMDR